MSELAGHLWEWHFANPSSALAREGFKPGDQIIIKNYA
jgi:DNA (cytosine-5)-methyltransferase 1